MNEVINNILTRRSIRNYKEELPSEETLDLLMKCTLSAPSAMDLQDWHFTIISNAQLISWLNETAKENFPPEVKAEFTEEPADFNIFYNTPALIVVSHDTKNSSSAVNCALATQNLSLAAHSLGLGTCIIGLLAYISRAPKYQDYLKELGIPNDYNILYGVTLGYPNENPTHDSNHSNKVNRIK